MDFISIIFILITILLLFLIPNFRSGWRRSPPKAAGSRPFTGHLHILNGYNGELPHVKLGSLADDHGPIFSINLGLRRAVVVSSFELAQELFTVNDLKVSNRAGLRALEILTHGYAMVGFTPYGSYWQKIRKLVTLELLSNRRIQMMRPFRESEIKTSIKELHELSANCEIVEMKNWFEELSFNVILRAVAGKKVDGVEKIQLIQAMKEFFEFAGMFVAADGCRILRFLDLGGYEKRMKETANEMERIVGRWLTEAEERRKEYSGEDKAKCFMDVLLSIWSDGDVKSDKDSRAIITATCENMILGAVHTTSVTLTWVLSLLINHPNALKNVQEELDDKIGRNRVVHESDLQDLVYLNAVIKETLRLYPSVPLGSPREFSENCVVGGFHIKKGTWLIVNIWKLQRDPRIWEREFNFEPERFLGKHKNMDVTGHNFELIPFGAGRRMCVGMNMGLQTVHIVLASLLHAFDINIMDDNKFVDMSESIGLTNAKVTPVNVLLTPRLPRDIYMAM